MFKKEEMIANDQSFDEASDLNNINYIMDSGEFAAISQLIPTLDSDVERSILAHAQEAAGGVMVMQEETMDVATKFQAHWQPLHPIGPPARSSFPGELNFFVEISSTDTNRRKYLYSHRLNRIYVDMRVSFPVTFRWTENLVPGPLFVRATVVFSDESQAEKRVEKCTQHTYENGADTNLTIVKNVLHSSREKNTQGVYYCGYPEHADSWYSVLVEFPSGPGTHAFEFGCKNSCPNGINRRATDIIFNLEDSKGLVYGRQIIGARVCACPRRDMHKDEETEGTAARPPAKRRLPAGQGERPAQGSDRASKVKVEVVEGGGNEEAITLPPLEVIGSRAVVAGLLVMAQMMEQAAAVATATATAGGTAAATATARRHSAAAAKIRAYIDGLGDTAPRPPQ